MQLKFPFLFSLAGKLSAAVIGFAASMVIARLLTPQQIGIFSLAFSLVGLSQILRDFGTGAYLIRTGDISTRDVQSAFTVSVVLGASVFAAFYLSAPALARFFASPELSPVLRLAAVTLVLFPISAPINALLVRELKQKVTAGIAVISALVTAVSTVWVSWAYELGAFGLAAATLCSTVVATVLTFSVRPAIYSMGFSTSNWRGIASLGLSISASNIVGHLGSRIAELVTAKVLGPAMAAQLNKADGAVRLVRKDITASLSSVLLPSLSSKLNTTDNVGARALLQQSLQITTVVLWPCYLGLFYSADVLIPLLFGDQWDHAIPALRILAFAGMASSIVDLAPAAFVAARQERRLLLVQTGTLAVRIALLAWLVHSGIQGVAFAIAISSVLQVPAYAWAGWGTLANSYGQAIRSLGRSLLVVLPIPVVMELVQLLVPGLTEPLWRILLFVIVAPVLWLPLVFLTEHPVAPHIRFVVGRMGDAFARVR